MFDWLRSIFRTHTILSNLTTIRQTMSRIEQLIELSHKQRDIERFPQKPAPYKPAEEDRNGILMQQIKEMADDIRNIDQLIWNMSQCSDFNTMHPHFLKLCEGMEARKKNESARINDIMRKELIKTYAPKIENMSPMMKKHLGAD